jgi:signal transduction histidine kinase
MSDNALPTLFKKYMQVSADHARKYGGTGLGLAICKQLVSFLTTQAICDLYFVCNKLKFVF